MCLSNLVFLPPPNFSSPPNFHENMHDFRSPSFFSRMQAASMLQWSRRPWGKGKRKRREGRWEGRKAWQRKGQVGREGRKGRQGEGGQEGRGGGKWKAGNLAPTVISRSRRLWPLVTPDLIARAQRTSKFNTMDRGMNVRAPVCKMLMGGSPTRNEMTSKLKSRTAQVDLSRTYRVSQKK